MEYKCANIFGQIEAEIVEWANVNSAVRKYLEPYAKWLEFVPRYWFFLWWERIEVSNPVGAAKRLKRPTFLVGSFDFSFRNKPPMRLYKLNPATLIALQLGRYSPAWKL